MYLGNGYDAVWVTLAVANLVLLVFALRRLAAARMAPIAAALWVLVIVLVPILGPLGYLAISADPGRNATRAPTDANPSAPDR